MDEEMKDVLYKIVGMIESVEKKVDNLEKKVDHLQQDVDEIKAEQKQINERLDTIASMYGSHEEAIRRLKAKKIL